MWSFRFQISVFESCKVIRKRERERERERKKKKLRISPTLVPFAANI